MGDIIGSPFEQGGMKRKNFRLFSPGCTYTDDSVMTLAVAEALLTAGQDASGEKISQETAASMRSWGRAYPHAGYGSGFRRWLMSADPKPYGSYGNGSAMRVSAAGWLYDSLPQTVMAAGATAAVTHNHPEGIKGAQATAAAIYLARTGSSKKRIRQYIEETFYYNLHRTVDEIRPGYHFEPSCQKTVPQAVIAFLDAKDFEDTVRNAVSLGGDSDTLGAIAGSIAEAYFGVPEYLKRECMNRITGKMREIVEDFGRVRHPSVGPEIRC